MPCFHPLKGWYSKERTANGKRSITFDFKKAYVDMPVSVPCGQCIGCRLERSRQWAIRCAHEASLYEHNCFITLTFDDNHLPDNFSLDVAIFQKFMKRLRKRFGDGIRFYHCGEYGETFGRPHYHACLFNFDFSDKKLWKVSNNNNLYVSQSLSELWPFGYSIIGDVTFQSAAYVARYIMKKITGEQANEHYEWVNPETGEIFNRKPEYTTMSRRPGIGKAWLDKFASDVYPYDFVVLNGSKMKPPKYYDRQFEIEYPDDFKKVRRKRVNVSETIIDNNNSARLMCREQVQLARLKNLPRNLD